MIKADEDALICDFAETYHVFNYKALPAKLAATLAAGLREGSRIKLKLADMQVSPDTMLLAAIADRLGILIWQKTKGAEKGRDRPKSILESLQPKQTDVSTFASGEDFIKAREKLLKGGA